MLRTSAPSKKKLILKELIRNTNASYEQIVKAIWARYKVKVKPEYVRQVASKSNLTRRMVGALPEHASITTQPVAMDDHDLKVIYHDDYVFGRGNSSYGTATVLNENTGKHWKVKIYPVNSNYAYDYYIIDESGQRIDNSNAPLSEPNQAGKAGIAHAKGLAAPDADIATALIEQKRYPGEADVISVDAIFDDMRINDVDCFAYSNEELQSNIKQTMIKHRVPSSMWADVKSQLTRWATNNIRAAQKAQQLA